ncbi:hypothetical protein C0Q70_07344 [Pomacea canaliculata]|uniref:Peptidase S1 domain-containing protein n=1 Tax=Pomacea canaliculata TaxID=400727 RepID=A0A2T7PES4_POMCA|nr:hypothetical protein C0Q70_07344 [Pomacea canaliculata]
MSSEAVGVFASAEDVDNLIVGGSAATYGDHPYMCSYQVLSGGTWHHICGCILYNTRSALTAAHCVGSYTTTRVQLGSHVLSRTDTYQVERSVSKYTSKCEMVSQHPSYSGSAAGYPNDIAVLEWTSPVTMNNYVRGATLDDGSASWAGQNCELIGWGRLTGGGSTADTLQKLTIGKITNSDCSSRWTGISGATINANHICFYSGTGKSSCNGDSGGPAACFRNGSRVIVGVTSWGISTCNGSYPSVYTRISKYRSWITSTAPSS